MLDIALVLIFLVLMALGLKRPFLWVLAYIYVDTLAPQQIGWSIAAAVPMSLIAFCAAFGGWLLADNKKGIGFTSRQFLATLFLLYCGWTTMNADFPVEAMEKWAWVWKSLVFGVFLPLTLRTRLRFEAAILILVLAAGTIIINAGMKTALGGGGYGSLALLVDNNTGIYESSTLATVAICIIPLILWLAKYGTIFPPDWRVKVFAGAFIFACLLVPIGTVARTGLLCIAALGMLMLRDVKRRILYISAGVMAVTLALPFVPQTYYDRMSTITEADGDESASTRLAVWAWTIDYAKEHPMGGGFDAFRSNKFTYKMAVRENDGNTTSVQLQEVTDKARAYHSSVFEVLGEQGYIGFTLWVTIHAIGLFQMEILRRRWRKREEPEIAWISPLASALQFAQLIFLVGSLFQGIAYQPFIWILIGIQTAFWTYVRRISKPRPRPIVDPGKAGPQGPDGSGGGPLPQPHPAGGPPLLAGPQLGTGAAHPLEIGAAGRQAAAVAALPAPSPGAPMPPAAHHRAQREGSSGV